MALLTAAVIAASLAGCQKEAQTVPTEAAETAAEAAAETGDASGEELTEIGEGEVPLV